MINTKQICNSILPGGQFHEIWNLFTLQHSLGL
jgi:hypothetical protein